MGKNHSNAVRNALKKAHEREVEQKLHLLHNAFEQWRRKEIDCWKLIDCIHEFHNGTSRDLYKIYELGDQKVALALALAKGILAENEVPSELYKSMHRMIEFFSTELTSSVDDAEG